MSLLSLREVSKSYRRGPYELAVLRQVSLDVHPGDFVAIYGQRGAGKTTLMKLAAGLEAPDSGAVLIEGEDLAGFSRRRLSDIHRDRIGFVKRSGPRSRELRMLDYVALPVMTRPHDVALRDARTALAKVGVEDCASETWDQLADAERTLVAIAAALVREPRLLLVDDPAAGLDMLERERVTALLRSAADEARIGVLMTVPDAPAMLAAHEVLSLSGGRLLMPSEPPPGRRGKLIGFPRGERSA